MARVIETGSSQFPEKYPGGQITMSVPIDQAQGYIPELREVKNPRDAFVIHNLYLGRPDADGSRPIWYDEAYPYKSQWGHFANREDYEATLEANGVSLPAIQYETEGEFWVARRSLHITVSTLKDNETSEKKLLLRRRKNKPRRMSTVNGGIEMVHALSEDYGFDLYDVNSLVLPGKTTTAFSLTERIQARGSDLAESLMNAPEGYPRKIIRGVVFQR